MLSIFSGADDQSFVVWVKDDDSELQLIVSDGEDVWQSPQPITSRDKPASRKHEADDAFLSSLRKALKKDARDSHGAFEVEIKPLESDIQLVIKETIGTTSTKSILFKATLERSLDRKGCFLTIFSQASEKMQKDVLEMISLNKSIANFTTLIESLSNNTKDMTTLKEKLHDELVSKFCMVLNTKKREIERLNQRIDELESQYESAPATQNTEGVVDLTSETQSTAAPKITKAPRGRAAPKTTTLECVTGSKRKAAAAKKAAPATKKKKAAVRKNAKRRADSESEDELEDSESEGSEEEESLEADEDGSRNDDGLSDQEIDLFDEDDEDLPTVTQGSAPGTQPSASADNTPLATRDRGRGKAIHATNSGSSSSSSSFTRGAVPVTLSAPLVADSIALRSIAEEESEEELLHSRPRLARGSAKEESPGPADKVVGPASKTRAVSHVSAAKPVTQHSPPEVPSPSKASAAPVAKSSKSKFYAEDSDEEGNCLDYL